MELEKQEGRDAKLAKAVPLLDGAKDEDALLAKTQSAASILIASGKDQTSAVTFLTSGVSS